MNCVHKQLKNKVWPFTRKLLSSCFLCFCFFFYLSQNKLWFFPFFFSFELERSPKWKLSLVFKRSTNTSALVTNKCQKKILLKNGKYQEPHILWASWEKNLRLFSQDCIDYFANKWRWWKTHSKTAAWLFSSHCALFLWWHRVSPWFCWACLRCEKMTLVLTLVRALFCALIKTKERSRILWILKAEYGKK